MEEGLHRKRESMTRPLMLLQSVTMDTRMEKYCLQVWMLSMG